MNDENNIWNNNNVNNNQDLNNANLETAFPNTEVMQNIEQNTTVNEITPIQPINDTSTQFQGPIQPQQVEEVRMEFPNSDNQPQFIEEPQVQQQPIKLTSFKVISNGQKKKNNFLSLLITFIFVGAICYGGYYFANSGMLDQLLNYTKKQITSITTTTLPALSESFNNLEHIKKINEDFKDILNITTEYTEDKFIIKVTGKDQSSDIEFTLKDNILTAEVEKDKAFGYAYYYTYLFAAKATLDGYDEEEALRVIADNAAANMTLEEHGTSVKMNDENTAKFKLRLKDKVKLIDLTDRYVTKDDIKLLPDTKNIAFSGNAGYMHYYYENDKNTTIIIIYEPKEFTKHTMDSLYNIIEYTRNHEEAEKIKQKYPKVVNTKIDNYTFTTNPKDDEEYEEYYKKGYVIVKVDIQD